MTTGCSQTSDGVVATPHDSGLAVWIGNVFRQDGNRSANRRALAIGHLNRNPARDPHSATCHPIQALGRPVVNPQRLHA